MAEVHSHQTVTFTPPLLKSSYWTSQGLSFPTCNNPNNMDTFRVAVSTEAHVEVWGRTVSHTLS